MSYEREISILRDLSKIKSQGFLKFLDCGFDQECDSFYIVTELLGQDINKLLLKCEGKKFRVETAIKIGLEMFIRIRDMHKKGYIHRDIKLSNFVCAHIDHKINNLTPLPR